MKNDLTLREQDLVLRFFEQTLREVELDPDCAVLKQHLRDELGASRSANGRDCCQPEIRTTDWWITLEGFATALPSPASPKYQIMGAESPSLRRGSEPPISRCPIPPELQDLFAAPELQVRLKPRADGTIVEVFIPHLIRAGEGYELFLVTITHPRVPVALSAARVKPGSWRRLGVLADYEEEDRLILELCPEFGSCPE